MTCAFPACMTSAMGHKKWCHARVMSVIPLKADIHQRGLHVRLVPQADFIALIYTYSQFH